MDSDGEDVMSSPDPLNDSLTSSIVRRITRSQKSQSFASLGGSSPRKQVFELEVGDNRTPQKLYVTVESQQGGNSTRRRLFTSPSHSPSRVIRRRERTTTTTVPLRGTSETAGSPSGITPRRRGRPPKIASTPMPGASSRKRSTTSVRKPTPGRPRKTKATPTSETPADVDAEVTPKSTRGRRATKPTTGSLLSSELSMEPTPGSSTSQTRRSTKRKSVGDDASSAPSSSARKRGRPRKKPLIEPEVEEVDELAELIDEPGNTTVQGDSIEVSTSPRQPQSERDVTPSPLGDAEIPASDGDIWMETLSDEVTPRAASQSKSFNLPSDAVNEPSGTPFDDAGDEPLAGPSDDAVSVSSRETTQQHETEIDYPMLYEQAESIASDAASDIHESAVAPNPRDLDTIVQSEEFSMIFMDSIPSLQASMNGHAVEPQEVGETTNLLINRTLESIKRGMHSDESSADEEIQEDLAEQEGAAHLQQDHSQAADNYEDHGFDDADNYIPDEEEQPGGLDAPEVNIPSEPNPPTPRQETPTPSHPTPSPIRGSPSPRWSGSPRRMKSLPLSRQLLTFKAMQTEQALSRSPSPAKFSSSKPSPRPDSDRYENDDSNLYEDSFSEIPDAVLEAATPRRPQRAAASEAHTNPDWDLPEHQRQDEGSAVSKRTSFSDARSDASRLLTPDETPSPTPDNTSDLKHADDGSEANLAGSTIQSKAPSVAETTQSEANLGDQSLLQDNITPATGITSSPQAPAHPDANHQKSPLPRERRPTLSPIVRAGLALQSVTSDQSSPVGRRSMLGSPFKASTNAGPRRGSITLSEDHHHMSSEPSVAHNQTIAAPAYDDDPFGPSSSHNGQTSFMKALDESMRQPSRSQNVIPEPSYSGTTRGVVDYEDEMSWVAEETISVPNPTATMASRTASMAATLGSTVPPPEDAIVSGDDGDEEEDDGDDDLWVAEAERPSPDRPRQQTFGTKPTNPPRRTIIPNTWRRGGNRFISLNNAGTAGKDVATQEASELEEYSLLSQQKKTAMWPQESSASKPGSTGRFDLSKYFSSPTVLPSATTLNIARASTAQAAAKPTTVVPVIPSNSMFPSLPQKEFLPSSSRGTSLFSPVRSPVRHQTPTEQSVPDTVPDTEEATSTPERIELPVVEQKKNFTPRSGRSGRSLFEPRPATSPIATTPPQMQLTRNDIARWREQTSAHLAEPPESPVLEKSPPRPLPHKSMSPSKSCLRSPLKPRTPGRVVEFARDIVRSPLQDVHARAQRPSRINPPVQLNPPKQPAAAVSFAHEDKENSPVRGGSDASMTDASPQTTPKPTLNAAQKLARELGTLSQKNWSRRHWLYLDGLLQLRRQGPYDFDPDDGEYMPLSADLPGCVISSQGESMTLEQWHVDVVDAFKSVVGGWDEAVLAKRLFALIVGEERRGMNRWPKVPHDVLRAES